MKTLLSHNRSKPLNLWVMKMEREIEKMSYGERLANYEREKMEIPRTANDSKTYEAALKALAKKWRI